MQKYFIAILLLFVVNIGFGQKCTYYHEDFCEPADYSYYIDGQSKSGLFRQGQKSALSIVVFDGNDYSISVCGPKKYGNIIFKVYEQLDEEKILLFDNELNNLAQFLTFRNEDTRKLIIEVKVPGKLNLKEPLKCVGVLVSSRKSEATLKAEESNRTGF